jgi:ribose 5-phosphate isomerase
LKQLPGVVECGLFVGLTDTLVVAGPNGITVTEATRLPLTHP